MTGPLRFDFIGSEREITAAADWSRPDWPHLWRYNLHYFDDLVATGADRRAAWHRDLMARWMTDNPPASGTGWEPYPTSLRIVNWVKWALAGNALDVRARHSLAVQTRWLRRREEIHLQGNHLWANAKALVFAGACFDGIEADRWLARGLWRIGRELAEQILADGGHYERSPMYHAIVLEDVLDLIQLAAIHPGCFDADDVAHWRKLAMRMLRWLRVMSHPDGRIALFNDAAFGIAPDVAALMDYARMLGIAGDVAELASIEALPDSGYVRLQAGPAVLIADVGEIGPAHLPGHAHADTLSFEFSLDGRRVLVNGGTSTYAAGAERLRQRGTAAHNTVTIDAEDSSEVWSSFRVARRAHPCDVAHADTGDHLCLRAGHDGYMRLPGGPRHQREWVLSARQLCVRDRIDGGFTRAVAHCHIHPDWRATAVTAQSGQLAWQASASGTARLRWQATPVGKLGASTYHPRFGMALPCQTIGIPFDAGQAQFTLSWGEGGH